MLLGTYRISLQLLCTSFEYEYSNSNPTAAEIVKYNVALGGVVLQMLLMMLLLLLLPLLLLLSLRLGARRASNGVVQRLRCFCDVALVWRPYYCSLHTYTQSVQQYTHAEFEFSCPKAPEPEPPKHQNPHINCMGAPI